MEVLVIKTIGDLYTAESLKGNTEFADKLKKLNFPSTTQISEAMAGCIMNEKLEFGELLKLLSDGGYGILFGGEIHSPFEYALKQGKYSFADKMLEFKFDINSLGLRQFKPLVGLHCRAAAILFAILKCSKTDDALRFVMGRNPDLNIRYGDNQETPLMVALRELITSCVDQLLAAGADVMLKTLDGKDAIDYCKDQTSKDKILAKYKIETFDDLIVREARRGNKDIVDELTSLNLQKSASLIKVIETCVPMDKLNLIKLIVTDFNAIFKKKKERVSILDICIRLKKSEILDYFLKCGADVDLCDPYGWSLLMCSVAYGDSITVKVLLSNKPNLGVMTSGGSNAFALAIMNRKFDIAEILMNNGCNIWVKDYVGRDVLKLCDMYIPNDQSKLEQWQKVVDMVKQKMEIKTLADLFARETTQDNSANVAELNSLNLEQSASIIEVIGKSIKMDKFDLIKLIVTDFKAICGTDNEKFNILKECSMEKKTFEVLEFFLKHGANINMVGSMGWSLLIYAASLNKIDLVRFLLENKANVDITSEKGNSALIIALNSSNRFDIAELLLDSKANITFVGESGNALDTCKKNDNPCNKERYKAMIKRLELLTVELESTKVKPTEPTVKTENRRMCTNGERKIAIPEDPLIKLFHDDNLEFDPKTMKKNIKQIVGLQTIERLNGNKWITETLTFPRCDVEYPQGFQCKFHVVPSGVICGIDTIVRFSDYLLY